MKTNRLAQFGSQLQDTRIGLYNPNFKYVTAVNTDIRKTFERVKREQLNGRSNDSHADSAKSPS